MWHSVNKIDAVKQQSLEQAAALRQWYVNVYKLITRTGLIYVTAKTFRNLWDFAVGRNLQTRFTIIIIGANIYKASNTVSYVTSFQ